MTEKTIRYDRDSRDFAMYLDGEFVGYAPTHTEATVILDALALDQIAAIPDGTPEDDYSDVGEGRASDMTIPATDDILAVVKERYDTARLHDDFPGARQLDRVRVNLDRGARLWWHLGDLLIQSVNNPGQVYSVSQRGCTCPNGAKGKAQCWHVCLFDTLLEMQEDRAAASDIIADAAAERAEQELGRRLVAARAQLAA